MTPHDRGERLFRALADVPPPPFDEQGGRTRFLEEATGASRRRKAAPAKLTAFALAAAFAAVVIVWRWPSPTPVAFDTARGPGEVGAWLATEPAASMPLSFSEGTRVVIEPDSRGRVERVSAQGASFVLERGAVRAKVVHRAATDWRFRAGPFEVQVTGTALEVQWDPARERFAVKVDEGAVVVHGPDLGPSRVVAAGERCVVDVPAHAMTLSSDGGAPRDRETQDAAAQPDADDREPPASLPPARVGPAATPWTVFEERGDDDAAYTAAKKAGLPSLLAGSSADDLLRLAHVSLVSGHRDGARAAWLACRRRFAGREQAAMAAYQLGRTSSPEEAASWFETYLREQPSGPLAREAFGRLVEARAGAGDEAVARDTATRYLSRYPDGPAAALARSILARTHE